VRHDQSLTPGQRDAAAKAIRTEAENSIRTVLGDDVWKAYFTADSYWLTFISRDDP